MNHVDVFPPETTDTGGRLYRVAEIFGPTVQGEGSMIGTVTFFVRFGGCDYRCTWCDSLHAVLPEHRPTWERLTVYQIAARLKHLGAQRGHWITLSGGNPALQLTDELVTRLHEAGFLIAMETQGSVAPYTLARLDHLCLSPKPPSSGNPTPVVDLAVAVAAAPRDTILKVVVFDDADLAYARDIFRQFPLLRHYVSVGNTVVDPHTEPTVATRERLLADYERLIARTIATLPPTVRVLPQLHTLVWGNARGV